MRTNTLRLTAIALGALLTTNSAVLADDPAGSTSSAPHPPRDTGQIAPQPMPVDPRVPTIVGIDRDLPPILSQPEHTPAPELTVDQDLDLILLGAGDFEYGPGACYGLIACCNSSWVQGCDYAAFFDDCEAQGGTVQVLLLSDGSHRFECHGE